MNIEQQATELIDGYISGLDEKTNRLKIQVHDMRPTIEAIFRVCASGDGRGLSPRVYVSEVGNIYIGVGITFTEMAQATRFLRALRAEGLRQTQSATQTEQGLHWYFANVDVFGDLLDGGACRRVQVGTTEVPVYEIQCFSSDAVNA